MKENGRIFNISRDMHNPPQNNFNWIGIWNNCKPNSELSKDKLDILILYFTYELKRK